MDKEILTINPAHLAVLQKQTNLVQQMNAKLSNFNQPTLGNAQHMPDSRIRVQLFTNPNNPNDPHGGVFFHQSGAVFGNCDLSGTTFNTGPLKNMFSEYGNTVFDFIFNECGSGMTPGSAPCYQGYVTGLGDGADAASHICGLFFAELNGNSATPYERVLVHELLHSLSIPHSFACGSNAIADVDPIAECNGNSGNCGDPNGFLCNAWFSGSNSLMGGNGAMSALSPCQIAQARRFILNNPPPSVSIGPIQPANGSNVIISNGQNITWTFERNVTGDITIEWGGSLTIKTDVTFAANSKITVKPNGVLILDCAHLKPENGADFWKGIIVEGVYNLPQAYDIFNNERYVGFLDSRNGSTIERAEIGAKAQGASKWSTGGVLQCRGTTFLNCKHRAVDIENFQNTNLNGSNAGNLSSFTGCNFTLDSNYPAAYNNFLEMAYLKNVDGIHFKGCNFVNSFYPVGQTYANERGYGINSRDAGFTVTGICNDNPQGPSCADYSNAVFQGFNHAIQSSIVGTIHPIVVTYSNFRDNLVGIFASKIPNAYIVKNNFYVGSILPPQQDPFSTQPTVQRGLQMFQCTGYKVEENIFYGTNNIANERFGIMTEDSGDDANLIRGNDFDYLEYANLAQGDNRGLKEGLQYHCNTNGGNNPRDFYVVGGFGQQGIHTSQGNGQAAMNTFSHFGTLADGDFRNEVGIIKYYHLDDVAQEPDNPTGLSRIEVQFKNACPEDETPCPFPCQFTSAEKQQIESDFNAARSSRQTEKTSLLTLMDGGDSEALLAEINGTTSQNAGQVAQHLLSLSPYLSTQALLSIIGMKAILTESAVVQVLNANPDELREAEILGLVQSSFSTTVADAILANTGTQTARTVRENLIGQYRSTMMQKADLLIQDIVKDTTQIDLPLLRIWLANKESLEANYAIVGTYLSEGDLVTAWQKLNEIPQVYSLDTEGLTEHGYFSNLVNIWQNANANGLTMAELNQQDITTVQNIADNSKRRAGAMAQGIVNAWYGGHYRVIPILPGGSSSLQVLMAPPIGNTISPVPKFLSAFPNPAKNSVSFHWKLPEGVGNATISISDLQGKAIEMFEIKGQTGKREWNVEQLGHGIYLYQLQLPDGRHETYKLTIIK